MSNDFEAPSPRCPYCQSELVVRLDVSDSLPVHVFRCKSCGTQYNIERAVPADAPPEAVSMSMKSRARRSSFLGAGRVQIRFSRHLTPNSLRGTPSATTRTVAA
jgi:transposase-like protein